MNYYKDSNEALHAIEEVDFNYLLPDSCVEITEEEYKGLIAAKNTSTSEQLWAEYQAKAKVMLDATDVVCLRCYKAGVSYPTEWLDYTYKLRAIVRSVSGDPTADFPGRPEYPAGT